MSHTILEIEVTPFFFLTHTFFFHGIIAKEGCISGFNDVVHTEGFVSTLLLVNAEEK